jgi:hypothetical protein
VLWTRGDSNPLPPPCESGALPDELRARGGQVGYRPPAHDLARVGGRLRHKPVRRSRDTRFLRARELLVWMGGIEPPAFRFQSGRAAAALHPDVGWLEGPAPSWTSFTARRLVSFGISHSPRVRNRTCVSRSSGESSAIELRVVVVGAEGFEPTTTRLRTGDSSRLSYTPMIGARLLRGPALRHVYPGDQPRGSCAMVPSSGIEPASAEFQSAAFTRMAPRA